MKKKFCKFTMQGKKMHEFVKNITAINQSESSILILGVHIGKT